MPDDGFEWDEDKAKSNLAKHAVSFEMAEACFHDPNAVEREDADPDELRFTRLCLSGTTVLSIAYVERGDRIRLISARRANRNEQRAHFEQA